MFLIDFIQRITSGLQGVLITIPVDNALGSAYVFLQNIVLIAINLVFGTTGGGGGLFGGRGGLF